MEQYDPESSLSKDEDYIMNLPTHHDGSETTSQKMPGLDIEMEKPATAEAKPEETAE